MKKCDKGWHDGSCCCNCKNHIPLVKHPWNKDLGKGRISEQMGFACIGFFSCGEKVATFFDMNHKHGMCELYQPKLNNK